MTEEKRITITDTQREVYQHMTAKFESAMGRNSGIELIHMISFLLGIVGLDYVKKKYEECYKDISFEEAWKCFDSYYNNSNEVENYLVGLTKEQVKKDDISSKRYRRYVKSTFGLNPINELLTMRIWHIALNKTGLVVLETPKQTYQQVQEDKIRMNPTLIKDD